MLPIYGLSRVEFLGLKLLCKKVVKYQVCNATVMMMLLCEKVIESHSQLVSLHLWEQPSDGGTVRNLFLGAIVHFVLKWVVFLLQKICNLSFIYFKVFP